MPFRLSLIRDIAGLIHINLKFQNLIQFNLIYCNINILFHIPMFFHGNSITLRQMTCYRIKRTLFNRQFSNYIPLSEMQEYIYMAS